MYFSLPFGEDLMFDLRRTTVFHINFFYYILLLTKLFNLHYFKLWIILLIETLF